MPASAAACKLPEPPGPAAGPRLRARRARGGSGKREALRRTKKVGLGQLAMRGREYLVSLKPCGRGIILETLRYADEV